MIYTKTQIELLSKALIDDKIAQKKLKEESKNLSALEFALRGSAEAIQWLLENDKILAAFDDAVGGNKSAVKLLLQKNEPALAAVANYLNGDDEALEWLQLHGFTHFLQLAQCIQKMHEKEAGKDVSFFFTP